MKTIKIVAASALVMASASAFAAKPTSIVFQANGENTEGTAFSTYMVKCSNGKKMELTAWDNRRKWCVGSADSTECQKKQIKAAKQACADS